MSKFVEKTKSYIQKKSIMIALIVFALFFVALYIGVLARPISYGMAYSGDVSEIQQETENIKGSITIKSNKKMTVKSSMKGSEFSLDFWIIVNGNKIGLVGLATNFPGFESMYVSEEKYNSFVDKLKSDENAWNNYWAEGSGNYIEANAFKLGDSEMKLTNNGAIAFAVVMGIVTVAVVVMAGLSINLFVKSKNVPQEAVTIENTNEQPKVE